MNVWPVHDDAHPFNLATAALDVAATAAAKHRRWVTYPEMAVAVGRCAGQRWVGKLVDTGGYDAVYRALEDAARYCAERAKAEASGYSYDDIAWYTPERVASLLPLAFDQTFDGSAPRDSDSGAGGRPTLHEGGTMVAMVADVRRALNAHPGTWPVLENFLHDDTPAYRDALGLLVEFLGGERPRVRR